VDKVASEEITALSVVSVSARACCSIVRPGAWPTHRQSLDLPPNQPTDLAYQAENGEASCSTMTCVHVLGPGNDPALYSAEFFDEEDGDDDQCANTSITSKDKEFAG